MCAHHPFGYVMLFLFSVVNYFSFFRRWYLTAMLWLDVARPDPEHRMRNQLLLQATFLNINPADEDEHLEGPPLS